MNTLECSRKRDVLARVAAFAELNSRQLDDLSRLCDERHIEPGDNLCFQREFGSDRSWIADGQLAVGGAGAEGAGRGPGQVVGDWALLGTGHRSAPLQALPPVDVVVAAPREIASLLMAAPAVARFLG